MVGVRVDPRTRAAATLEAFLGQFDLPVLAYLRDSQIYPNAAFNGMSIFDLAPYVAAREQEHWLPVIEWLRLDTDGPGPGSLGAGLKLTTPMHLARIPPLVFRARGGAVWQLVGLITRRS